MNNEKFIAKREEGKEISRLLESPTDTGLIQAIYTRRPDAYESYMKEAGDAKVYSYKKDGKIVATCSEIVRDVYVGGEVKRSRYICGLKRDPNYKGFFTEGLNMIDSLRRDDVDFNYFTVVSNNDSALSKFNKLSRFFSLKHIVKYTTYMINPKVRIKEEKNNLLFKKATSSDMDKVLEFINKEGKKKDLFPVVNSLDDFYNLSINDFYLLYDKDELVACGGIWDVGAYKQYTILKYRGIAKLARIFNPLLSLFGYVKFPKENSQLKFPMISFFLSKNSDESFYKVFLNRIKKEIKKKYELFCLALPKNHPLTKVLKKLPKITIDADIYELKFSGQDNNVAFNYEKIATESALL